MNLQRQSNRRAVPFVKRLVAVPSEVSALISGLPLPPASLGGARLLPSAVSGASTLTLLTSWDEGVEAWWRMRLSCRE